MRSVKEAVADRRRALKAMVVAYLGDKCHRCGFDGHQAALVPHHVNPVKKVFEISNSGITRSWAALQVECKKCILLCRNCHGVVHATNEEFYFNEANIPVYEDYVDTTARSGRDTRFCVDCNIEVSPNSQRCLKCSVRENATSKKRHKIEWPPLAILENMLLTRSCVSVAKELGVSDNAVKKHMRTAKRHSLS